MVGGVFEIEFSFGKSDQAGGAAPTPPLKREGEVQTSGQAGGPVPQTPDLTGGPVPQTSDLTGGPVPQTSDLTGGPVPQTPWDILRKKKSQKGMRDAR